MQAPPIQLIQQSTCYVLCPKVGTMAEVEVLQALVHMALSIGYNWLVDGLSLRGLFLEL